MGDEHTRFVDDEGIACFAINVAAELLPDQLPVSTQHNDSLVTLTQKNRRREAHLRQPGVCGQDRPGIVKVPLLERQALLEPGLPGF